MLAQVKLTIYCWLFSIAAAILAQHELKKPKTLGSPAQPAAGNQHAHPQS